MKFLLSLLLVAAISSGAFAQHKRSHHADPEKMATRMTEKMMDRMNLNEEQKEQVYQSNLRLAQAKKENREEMKTAAEQHNAEMKEILTEEQYETYVQQRNKMRERAKERHKQRADKPE